MRYKGHSLADVNSWDGTNLTYDNYSYTSNSSSI